MSRNLTVLHPEQPKMMSIFEDLSWLRVGGGDGDVLASHWGIFTSSTFIYSQWPRMFSSRPNRCVCRWPSRVDHVVSLSLFLEEKTSLWLHWPQRGYLLWSCRVKLRVHLPPWWMMRSRSGSPSNFQGEERKQLCVLSRFRSVSRKADSPRTSELCTCCTVLYFFLSLLFLSIHRIPGGFFLQILWYSSCKDNF